ncbi:hypothetical protein BY996DRAFT_8084090 [Phakopsora pachyrhizi]|nr:hypothetical protein BY996DRAFT_8084090 [Phakopsora pachyrhizi]
MGFRSSISERSKFPNLSSPELTVAGGPVEEDQRVHPKDILLALLFKRRPSSVRTVGARHGNSQEEINNLQTKLWMKNSHQKIQLRAKNEEKGNASLTENSWKERLGGAKLQSSTDLGEQQEDVKASPLELPALAVESSQPSYLKLRQSLSSLTGKWPKAILSTMGAESSSCSGLAKEYTNSQVELGHPKNLNNQSTSASTSSLHYSNSFYGGKLKKNFNLGKKIDDWWKAVRKTPSNWMHL